jgi:hypothetical protein
MSSENNDIKAYTEKTTKEDDELIYMYMVEIMNLIKQENNVE